jgi:hypothetical protein
MIAISKKQRTPAAWHTAFEAMLPKIRRHARRAFWGLCSETRDDLVEEVIANACVAYGRLVELGKSELAYASPLAAFAIRQVRQGRRVGSRLRIRDVSSAYAQRRHCFAVERLDQYDASNREWREVLVEDRTATPADIACFKIDFESWLRRLTVRRRRIAMVLASGEQTTTAARQFDLTAGRISQLRNELRASWAAFQGDAPATAARGCSAA